MKRKKSFINSPQSPFTKGGIRGVNLSFLLIYKFLCLITLLFFASCTSEEPAGVAGKKLSGAGSAGVPKVSGLSVSSESGRYSLQIVPTNVSRNSTIYAVAQGFNLPDAKVVWLVNGIRTTAPSAGQFKATNKGDKIQVKAIIQGKEVLSNLTDHRQ
jgi:hypothetical protein